MKIKKMTFISLCAALMFIFSQIAIPVPFTTVPITMQTFGVILISCLFDYKISFTSLTIYVLLGAIGIPVFSGFSGGFMALIGPCGGYIWGFLLMTIIIGLFNKFNNKVVTFTGAYLALAVDYLLGVLQLKIVAGLTISGALASGLYPFIIKDLIVTAVAVTFAIKVKSFIPKKYLYSL